MRGRLNGCHVPWLASGMRRQLLRREKSHRDLQEAASFGGWPVQLCTTRSTERLVPLPVATRAKESTFPFQRKTKAHELFHTENEIFPVSWVIFGFKQRILVSLCHSGNMLHAF